ncbi:MAG: hypothetical protein PHI35_01070, partial [Victivallaceae bacterium]|nr:hypothetical protein [Victivallaceae bacterium]
GVDALHHVDRPTALRGLTPATCDLPRFLAGCEEREVKEALMRKGFSFAEQIAETLPAWRLAATLTGDSARVITEGIVS